MTGFWTIEVVVDDALEIERELSDEEYEPFIEQQRIAALDGKPTEVYAMWHDHAPLTNGELDAGVEDTCIQYQSDLRPTFTWNKESNA